MTAYMLFSALSFCSQLRVGVAGYGDFSYLTQSNLQSSPPAESIDAFMPSLTLELERLIFETAALQDIDHDSRLRIMLVAKRVYEWFVRAISMLLPMIVNFL